MVYTLEDAARLGDLIIAAHQQVPDVQAAWVDLCRAVQAIADHADLARGAEMIPTDVVALQIRALRYAYAIDVTAPDVRALIEE